MYRIIVVDDSALFVKGLIANLDLASLGAGLHGAFLNAPDVIACLKKDPDIDLIISDIRMPYMTGLEMAREALAINPQIKIILISAYDDFEYAQEALRIGVFDYIQKPLRYDALSAAIQKALQRLDEERQTVKRLEEAQPALIDKFYTDLIHTHPLAAESLLKKRADYLGIAHRQGAFLCIAMVSELTEAEDQPVSVEKNILHLLAMPEDLCKHFSQDMSCYPICERDHILLILHRPGLDQGSMQELSAKICHEFAEAHTDRETRLYFGIGSAVEALWDITSSVDSALHAVNKRIIFPDQSVFHDDAGDAGDLTFISRLSETESEIERLLLQRNTIELSRVSYQLVDHCRRRFKDSLVAVSYIYVLGSVILGRLSQDSLELTDALSHLISFGSKKRMSVSTAEITDFLMNFFACIIKDLNNSQISYQEKLIAGIRTYIGEQLHDTQLRLESIAAQFHMHPSHLSRLFKKYEKINVSDYITGKRIQWAEKLLLSGIDPISVISEQVGYASPYYFSACFKKLTGKTPSEYRRNP